MKNYWRTVGGEMENVLTDKGYGVNNLSVGDKVWIADMSYFHHTVTEGIVLKITKRTAHIQMVNDPAKNVSIFYKCNYSKYHPDHKYVTYMDTDFGYSIFNGDRFPVEN